MTDIILESIRAAVLLGIFLFLWNSGRNRFEQLRKGWNYILLGFGLLLFGSVLDISDNFESLNPYIVIGDTDTEAFLEKFVGFLGGFFFLAVGLIKWIPGVQGISDLVETRTQDLLETNEQLVKEIAERERAENVKHEFTSIVSHELRTPLTSIKGSLGLIKSGAVGQLPEKIQSMLDIAYNNSDRLVLLINDILDIEKIRSEGMEFNMAPMDIASLVEDSIDANKGYAIEKNITFVKTNGEKKALVNGDKDRLMQVLSNLLSNAAKFSPSGDQVELSVTRESDIIRVAVKDNGPGVPEEFRESIFDMFTQSDSSDSRQSGGTGLGLNIAKAIVEHHSGNIGFNTKVGVGSTFYFTLPALE